MINGSSEIRTDLPRVCFLIETFHPVVGGAQAHARLLARHLRELGIETFVLTRRADAGFSRFEVVDGIPVRRLPPCGPSRFGKYRMVPFALAELFRRRKDYDLIFVCGFRVLGVPAVLASRALGKICVLRAEALGEMSGSYASVYGELSPVAHFAFRSWIRLRNSLLKRADAFVSISGPIADEFMRSGVDRNRISEIPNGIATELFRPADAETRRALRRKLKLPADGCIAMYSGRLVRGKGLEHLLRAWETITSARKDMCLALVGSGHGDLLSREDELRRFVSERDLQSRVIFTGAVSNVHEYLQAADVFVFPSEHEAFGLSLVEAMSCGLPVVACAVGGIPEIIRHSENGILAEPGDSDALAREIPRLLDQPELAQSLGAKARQTVCERYSINVVSGRYRELFSSLCARKVSAPAAG